MKAMLVASLALLLAACDGEPPLIPPEEDASVPQADAGPVPDGGLPRVDSGVDGGPPPAALVRLIHAAPGVPSVDFRAAERIVSPDVYYRAATPYARVAVGETELTVTAEAGETIAASEPQPLEDGARYLAILMAPPAEEPRLIVLEETAPPGGDLLSVRVVNATHETASLDVDLDGSLRAIEVDDLAAGAASDWIEVDPIALRPVVLAGEGEAPFTITQAVAPWLAETDRVLVVAVGRPIEAQPSEVEGLSLLLVLEATEDSSPAFILRPDPRLAILHSAPLLPVVSVSANHASGGDPIPLADVFAYGELIEATLPPGQSYISMLPEGEIFGPQVSADLLAGHRYLMITRGDPEVWGPGRFEATVVRDAIEGSAFVIVNASPDTPGAMRWYGEGASGWAAIDALPPMEYGGRSAARGVAIDAAARLGVAREDRSAPNVYFDAASAAGARGFAVLAGSYFAAPDAPDAQALFYVWAPEGGAWTVERIAPSAGSGPLPDETPPSP